MLSLLVVFVLSIISLKAFRVSKSQINPHGGILTAISPEGVFVPQSNASSSMISIMGVPCLDLLPCSDCFKCPLTCEHCFQCEESGCHRCKPTPIKQQQAVLDPEELALIATYAPRSWTTCSPDSGARCEEPVSAEKYCDKQWLDQLAPTGQKIGSGSFGSVIAIRNRAGEAAMVAVKKYTRLDAMSMAEAEAEIQLLMNLKNAYIVKGFSHGNVEGFPTVVMELAEYGDLGRPESIDVLGSSASRHFYQGLAVITIQILKALEYLHGQGLMHADIKPDNILLTSHRIETYVVAKLGDLGNALRLHNNNSYTRVPMAGKRDQWGTLRYNSPEFLKGNIPSESDDRWAFGIVLFILAHKHQKYPPHFNPPARKLQQRIKYMILGECPGGIQRGMEQDYFKMPEGVKPCLEALVHGLLTVEVGKRMTIAVAVKEAIRWAQQEGIHDSVIRKILAMDVSR